MTDTKIFEIYEYDWSQVPAGTLVVFEHVSPKSFRPREDGLFLAQYRRLKTDKPRGNWDKGWTHPVFADPTDRKRLCTWSSREFAFADDPEGVRQLLDHVARENAVHRQCQENDRLQREKDEQARKAQREIERKQREDDLRQKAESVGMSYDDLCDVMRLWDEIRDRNYRPDACFICGCPLTDPVSISLGIGPVCIQRVPNLLKVMKAKIIEIGRWRYNSDRLIQRFGQAGLHDMAEMIQEQVGNVSLK